MICLDLTNPVEMEKTLNNILGVVTNGVFAIRKSDVALIESEKGVEKINF